MACNSCAKAFSLLRKEKGCPGCGFSYCSKCLDNKIYLPKKNGEAKVCAKCKRSVSNPNEAKTCVQPPDVYYKRIGVIDNKEPATTTSNNTNVDIKDQLIWERLKKLKEDGNVAPPPTTDEQIRNRLQNIKGEIPSTSDTELQSKLARLKGVPIESFTSKPVLLPPDTRTEQEQANELLKQYMEVTNIDTKYKDEFDGLISDIELRMKKLRGADTSKPKEEGTGTPNNIESDDEDAVRKIVERIKVEASLEDSEVGPSTNDELPFCEICNEDARMRCLGCKYLFCKRCFSEHKDDDDGCNRYEPYQAPANH